MSKFDPTVQREPVFNAPPGVLVLCGLLVALHAVPLLLGQDVEFWILEHLSLLSIDLSGLLGFDDTSVPTWRALNLVSYAFLHANWMHLLINAGMLLALGSVVERAFGIRSLYLIFALGAIAGAVVQSLVEMGGVFVMVGASASVYAMMGLVVMLMVRSPAAGLQRRGIYLAAVLLVLNLLTGIFGIGELLGGADIAWEAHIGGFALGLLAYRPLVESRKSRGR